MTGTARRAGCRIRLFRYSINIDDILTRMHSCSRACTNHIIRDQLQGAVVSQGVWRVSVSDEKIRLLMVKEKGRRGGYFQCADGNWSAKEKTRANS